MERKKELMRKEYLLLGISVILLLTLISIVSAAITVISPANNTKNKGYIPFNVTYINDTDFTDATNATFYYNLSGTWQLIGNVSTCTKAIAGAVASCNASLNVSILTQGRYSINATLANLTTVGAVSGSTIITYNVTFDYTPPNISIIFPTNNSNVSSLTIEINYSRGDNLGFIDSCWFSNNSGINNNTLANCANITGKTWLAGFNNITIWANDTTGNLNYSFVSFFVDNVNPNISIVYPTNNSNVSSLNIEINYTRGDNLGITNCWYSNSSGPNNNNSLGTTCTNITGKTWLAGFNNITIWVNDTVGNQNYSSVSFFVDNVKPNISIVYPSNNSNVSSLTIEINYTRNDNRGITNCWYSNSSGPNNNNSLGTACTNITGKTWLAGFNNITIWVNDTVGNQNYSFVSFFVDNVNPRINITFPTNDTNSNNTNLDVNYTFSDNLGITNCWYSNDTYLKNMSITNCANITDVYWVLGAHNVTVWINDTVGNVNSSSVRFSIIDVIFPTATFSCSPSTVNRGSTVTCSCNPSDSESGINTSATVYQTNPSTSEIGILTVYCYFADLSGNANNLSTTYFVFDQGGGGVLKPKSIPSTTSAISTEVIEKSESWAKISPDVPEIMKDFDKDMGIKQIQIEVTSEAKNVQMTVTESDSKPAEVSASKDEAYKYLDIKTKNLTDKLSKAIIDIQVEKSWISENNLDKKDIALFKFNETSDQWKELPTIFKEEDSTYDYYDIELKSFSYFAIASKEVKEKKFATLIWIIILVLITAVLLFFIIRKNKIKKLVAFFTNLKRKIKTF